MRRRRKEQNIGRSLGEAAAELVAGDRVRAAAQAMGFVHHDEIPACCDEILETTAVEFGDPGLRPAAAPVEGLH
ncbi:hypothetical protein D3C71_1856650 [compost metagenome]